MAKSAWQHDVLDSWLSASWQSLFAQPWQPAATGFLFGFCIGGVWAEWKTLFTIHINREKQLKRCKSSLQPRSLLCWFVYTVWLKSKRIKWLLNSSLRQSVSETDRQTVNQLTGDRSESNSTSHCTEKKYEFHWMQTIRHTIHPGFICLATNKHYLIEHVPWLVSAFQNKRKFLMSKLLLVNYYWQWQIKRLSQQTWCSSKFNWYGLAKWHKRFVPINNMSLMIHFFSVHGGRKIKRLRRRTRHPVQVSVLGSSRKCDIKAASFVCRTARYKIHLNYPAPNAKPAAKVADK